MVPISTMPSTISSGKSCGKLLVPHKMTAFFKEEEIGQFCTHHKTFCTLSPTTLQLRASIGLKKLFHILYCFLYFHQQLFSNQWRPTSLVEFFRWFSFQLFSVIRFKVYWWYFWRKCAIAAYVSYNNLPRLSKTSKFDIFSFLCMNFLIQC